MSIKVEDITKFYGKQEALSHISFEAEKGEIIGFLGPNGAGKSTMMKILTAYIAASEGKAYVAGYDVEEDAIKVKSKIGYLPEHNSLYTEMYVKEFLHFIAGMYGLDIELVMPENSTRERVQTMRAYGAKVTLTPVEVGIEGSRAYAQRKVDQQGYCMLCHRLRRITRYSNDFNTQLSSSF